MPLEIKTHVLSEDEKTCVLCGIAVPQPIEGFRGLRRGPRRVGVVSGLKMVADFSYFVGGKDTNQLCLNKS